MVPVPIEEEEEEEEEDGLGAEDGPPNLVEIEVTTFSTRDTRVNRSVP